jgi:MoxR-like ATPase
MKNIHGIYVKVGTPLMNVLIAAFHANQPVLLIGAHGVGKSQFVEAAAKALDIGCEIYDLSIMEPVDLAGLPEIKDGRMRYAPAKRLPTDGKGFLFFEELNRVSRDLRAACLQICTARRFNDYRLPDGWLPIAAINPSEEEC